MDEIKIKRAYETSEESDGFRILVDRLWPRGRSKAVLKLDWWAKEIAPTDETRQNFCHDPAKFPNFKESYLAELAKNPAGAEFLQLVKEKLSEEPVTLVYGARDERFNQAVVLREWLLSQLKP